MKPLLITLALIQIISITAKANWTNGYYRRDGTYVSGYQHTKPDSYRENNYGYQEREQRAYERQIRDAYQQTDYRKYKNNY